ncbi:multisubunit Na+/H+ antiporter MnhC subunit [Oikeobacillus pervagus]|uniref:Multisubunit Na+/H+ antiporter MnhC subunit n=1 Tax=Oikeobacillus pervagus TaxID=1325931 RepID=A0AAJ1SZV1_9BACI|nr:oligosaccharide repeat unit polymerase [Oikeobacillus pervagus]MDQ0215920.1 multisubunit Na+/H+ antiporter MnhC subunit [Oikeobacillus pervagus]
MNQNNFIRKLNHIDIFSPYFFLPFIIALYFLTSLVDFHRFEYLEVRRSILIPVLLGFLAYFIGVYIAGKRNWMFPTFGLGFLKGKTAIFLYVLGGIGLIAYGIMFSTGQIGLQDESVRRNLDPKLNFLSSFLWFSTLFLVCNRALREGPLMNRKKLVYGSILFIVLVLFLIMGYRTPILVMVFTLLIVFHYTVKQIKLTWFMAALVLIGVAFSLFGYVRSATEDQSKSFNQHKGPDVTISEEKKQENLALRKEMESTPEWLRALNNESVTGHIVFSKLIEYVDQHGFLYGDLHKGILAPILPGEQRSPRTMVSEMVNSISIQDGKYITRPGRTTTPTLFGQFYVEAGNLAIIIGFALYGLILSMLYNQMKNTGIRSYQTVGYAFVTTIFTISMHTGLLDLIFFLMIAYAIVSTSIEKTSNCIKKV